MISEKKHESKMPDAAIIAITEKCNSKCSFCNIWRTNNPQDLDINIIDKLPSSLKYVDITGGEPFLHNNFETVIEKFAKRKCKIIINTNGIMSLRKYEPLWKMKNLGVRFSLDAIGQKHDELRGVKGCYEAVLKNIGYLKSVNFNNIGISCTFSDTNIDQMGDLYTLSEKLRINFTCMIVGNSEIYYKKADNIIKNPQTFRRNINKVIAREIGKVNVKTWAKAIYMNELMEFIDGKIKNIHCPAGSTFFFMLPSGGICACNMRNLLIGDLSKKSFKEIWFSARAEDTRTLTGNCNQPCWTMCNAKLIISNNKFKYLGKFLKTVLKTLQTKNE